MLRGIVALLATSAAVVDAAWKNIAYETEKFTSPSFDVHRYNGGKTAPGSIFLGMVHPVVPSLNGPLITNDDGELIWHGPGYSDGIYNFQAQALGGVQRLTFWTGYLDYSGHGYGQLHVYDDKYRKIKKICLPPSVNNNIVVPRPNNYPGNRKNPCYMDKHESLATDRNSIIVTAYNATQTDLRKVGGPKDGWVYDCLFFELSLEDNSVLFQWNALDHVPVTKSNWLNTTGDDPLFINGRHYGHSRSAPWDFFHINSIQDIPGGYLISSRMTWSIYKVHGKSGKLDWTLEPVTGGDFKINDPIFWSWQHHPRIQHASKDGKELTFHFFNDDNIQYLAQGKNVSTGPMLHLNDKTKQVNVIYNLQTQPTGGIYSVAEGSQLTLPNGNHLVGYGSQAFIQEYNPQNQLLYSAQFAGRNQSTHSYRTYKLPWKATPVYKPKVVAKKGTNNIQVYMSWNGATEYKAWKVYAGPTATNMKVVKNSVKKKGFETQTSFKPTLLSSYQYVMLEALNGKGKSMKKSKAVQISGASTGV